MIMHFGIEYSDPYPVSPPYAHAMKQGGGRWTSKIYLKSKEENKSNSSPKDVWYIQNMDYITITWERKD